MDGYLVNLDSFAVVVIPVGTFKNLIKCWFCQILVCAFCILHIPSPDPTCFTVYHSILGPFWCIVYHLVLFYHVFYFLWVWRRRTCEHHVSKLRTSSIYRLRTDIPVWSPRVTLILSGSPGTQAPFPIMFDSVVFAYQSLCTVSQLTLLKVTYLHLSGSLWSQLQFPFMFDRVHFHLSEFVCCLTGCFTVNSGKNFSKWLGFELATPLFSCIVWHPAQRANNLSFLPSSSNLGILLG